MKTKISILIVVLLAGMVNIAAAKNNPSKVNGTVFEKVNGVDQPVALAYVYVDNTVNCTYTNLDGSFDLDLPSGKHTIKVVFKGYETESKKVNLKKGEELKIQLKPVKTDVAEK